MPVLFFYYSSVWIDRLNNIVLRDMKSVKILIDSTY